MVRVKAILLALVHPGIRILIVRRTYPQLKANHIDLMRADLYGIARYMSSDKEFIFPNGSRIAFGYCDTDTDVERYQGVEYDVIFIDEATTLREEWIKKIVASCRGANKFPKRLYYTMNPGGESHAYFRRLFIDRRFEEGENPDDYTFIQSLVTDNAALMEMQPDYLRQLEALPYKLRQAWRYGSWDILEGVFFEEFRDDPEHYIDRIGTHVIEPFDIPKHWPIYRSFDWGRAKPYACHWWTIDHEGIAYCILESYGIGREPNEGCMWDADQVFTHIAEAERTHPWLAGKQVIGVADPSIWQKDTGISVYDVAAKHGVYFSPADNKRIPGWLQFHYRLRFDDQGYPRMYFFKNCAHMIRTIPLMMYDKRKVEDLDSDLEDHACVIGSTVISTPSRGLRIDTMVDTVGYVIGHDGLAHKYTGCMLTKRDADVYTLTTDDGRSVTATPDHPFLTADGKWVRMDRLQLGDELMEVSPCRSMLYPKANRNIGDECITDVATISSARESDCIGRYGRKKMAGKCQKDITSIISTETSPTMRLRTFNSLKPLSICRFTARRGRVTLNISNASGRSLLRGTDQRKAESGTANMGEKAGNRERRKRMFARNAARRLNLLTSTQSRLTDFAGTIVNQLTEGRLELTISGAVASGADKNTVQTSICKRGFAQENVVPKNARVKAIVYAGKHDVYNMTVEGSHSYIANGLAVHNCDSGRYFCMMHPITPVEPKPTPTIIIDPLQSMDVQMQRYRRTF